MYLGNLDQCLFFCLHCNYKHKYADVWASCCNARLLSFTSLGLGGGACILSKEALAMNT